MRGELGLGERRGRSRRFGLIVVVFELRFGLRGGWRGRGGDGALEGRPSGQWRSTDGARCARDCARRRRRELFFRWSGRGAAAGCWRYRSRARCVARWDGNGRWRGGSTPPRCRRRRRLVLRGLVLWLWLRRWLRFKFWCSLRGSSWRTRRLEFRCERRDGRLGDSRWGRERDGRGERGRELRYGARRCGCSCWLRNDHRYDVGGWGGLDGGPPLRGGRRGERGGELRNRAGWRRGCSDWL